MRTYTTQNGDTWDLIAFRMTGSTDHIETIMQANQEHVKTFIFPAGVEIIIPDLESYVDYDSLPPWRRDDLMRDPDEPDDDEEDEDEDEDDDDEEEDEE